MVFPGTTDSRKRSLRPGTEGDGLGGVGVGFFVPSLLLMVSSYFLSSSAVFGMVLYSVMAKKNTRRVLCRPKRVTIFAAEKQATHSTVRASGAYLLGKGALPLFI